MGAGRPGPLTARARSDVTALNPPAPITVSADRAGRPRRVLHRGRWREVAAVLDRWRLDEGWWSAAPIRRLYFRVELDGAPLVVYHDLEARSWWTQRD